MSTAELFALADEPAEVVVRRIRTGLPASAFGWVAVALGLPKNALAHKLGIITRTIDRRLTRRQALSPEVSEKLVRVVRTIALLNKLFTDQAARVQWLNSPAPALNHAKPIDLLDTDVGARQVEGVIQGVLYGNVM